MHVPPASGSQRSRKRSESSRSATRLRGSIVALAALVTLVTLAACTPPRSSPIVAPTTAPPTSAPATTMPATSTPPTTMPPTTTTTPPAPVPADPTDPGAGRAASRVIFWTNCWQVAWLSDAQLDQWQALGVGGFVCGVDYLRHMGGSQDFTGDPTASLSGSNYDLQRLLRDRHVVARTAARGMQLWLGVKLGNYYNARTPLMEWFDDGAWSTGAIPDITQFAAGARALGFAGLAFDEEAYETADSHPTWNWAYPGNTHSETVVRAQVTQRGQEMMRAIATAFPGVDIIDYGAHFPNGWYEYVQQQINGIVDADAPSTQIDFWNGLTSVPGYGPIRFIDETFYKTPHIYRATWDGALTYNDNRLFATFSRRFANWSYASTRVQVSPFAWIDAGPTGTYDAARDPAYVADQLAAFRRWGMGGAFANFAYAPLGTFDYTPYATALQAAATAGVVDNQAPGIVAGTTSGSPGAVTVTGSATDNLAIRAVHWRTASGASGAARMDWTVTGGDYASGYQWRMSWSATVPAAAHDQIVITAEDVKGLQSSTTVVAP